MARSSRLALSIFFVPGLLRRILRAWRKLAQALKDWGYRRLESSYLTTSLADSASTCWKVFELAKLPGISINNHGKSATRKGESVDETSECEKNTTDNGDFQYHPIVGGERISLDNILPSLSISPLSGGSIRNASASTRSLASSISAHSNAVEAAKARTPGPSVAGNPSRTASLSTVNISVMAPEQSSYTLASQMSISDENSLLDADRFRLVGSPGEQQERDALSYTFENNSSPASSIELETRSHSSSIEDRESVHVDDSGVDVSNSQMQQEPATYLEPEPILHPTPQIWPHPHIPTLGDINIVPTMPEELPSLRYRGRPQIAEDVKAQPPIPPLTTKFGELSWGGWEFCIHPEGARYFYNKEKRIYVEGDVEKFEKQVNDIVGRIEGFLYRSSIRIDSNTDLVVWLRTPTVSNPHAIASACYYFVHHTSRTIFFLDGYNPQNMPVYKEIGGITSQLHLGDYTSSLQCNEIESQYWFHCQLFPHSLRLTNSMIKEMRGIVLHYIGDTTSSPKDSTAPFELDDLYKLLNLTAEIEKSLTTQHPSDTQYYSGRDVYAAVGANSCFSRHMFMFSRARFLHFHGEPHARLDRTTSVYANNDPHRRSLLIKTLSWSLFFAPDFHLRDLQNMWVDGITHRSVFQRAVLRMNGQWAQMNLMATVFLAVDVSFWSIQNSDMSSGSNRSPAQIFSYLSACSCITSIVLGMLLLLQHQTKMRETADDFEQYMKSWHRKYVGLETLAILHSLPFAILMWGIVFFSLGVTSLCFIDASIPTRTIIGFAIFVSLILVSWCVQAHWDKEETEENPEWLEKPNSSLQQSDFEPHRNHPAVHSARNMLGGFHEMTNFIHPHIDPSSPSNDSRWYSHWQPNNIGRRSIQSFRSFILPDQNSNLFPA